MRRTDVDRTRYLFVIDYMMNNMKDFFQCTPAHIMLTTTHDATLLAMATRVLELRDGTFVKEP